MKYASQWSHTPKLYKLKIILWGNELNLLTKTYLMKKRILIAFLTLIGFSTFAQTGFDCEEIPWKIEPYQDPEGCCVIFHVLESTDELPWKHWFVETGPGTPVGNIYSNANPDGVFEICYDEPGIYNVVITYVDELGNTLCETNWSVFVERGCSCNFHLCWSANGDEPSMQAFDELSGIKVVNWDGTVETHELFSPAIPIATLFSYILENFEEVFINEFKLDSSAVGADSTNCFKGSYPQPGFSVTGNFMSVSFYGYDHDGNPIQVFFESDCGREEDELQQGGGNVRSAVHHGTGILDAGQLEIVTQPNPAHDIVTITLKGKAGLNDPQLILFDNAGREVYRSEIEQGEAKRVDISTLKTGLYVVRLMDGEMTLSVKKLIIE